MLTVSLQYINCRLNHLDDLIFSIILFYFSQNTAQKVLTKVTEFNCSAQSNLCDHAFFLSEQATEFSKSEDCKLSYIIQHILCDFKTD